MVFGAKIVPVVRSLGSFNTVLKLETWLAKMPGASQATLVNGSWHTAKLSKRKAGAYSRPLFSST